VFTMRFLLSQIVKTANPPNTEAHFTLVTPVPSQINGSIHLSTTDPVVGESLDNAIGKTFSVKFEPIES
jgi:hypothetical protein